MARCRWAPGRGVAADLRARWPHYADDWRQGANWGARILAPSCYIFFASVLPALAFGQQLAMETDGALTVVHLLVATALAGLVQSVAGGQPLLIVGVAEPIVLIYSFLYRFAAASPALGPGLFLPWAAWVCAWTAVLCAALALSGACALIDKFTRFSGEVFGALIAVLFLQVGLKGIVQEFRPAGGGAASAAAAGAPGGGGAGGGLLLLVNGLWGLLLSAGVLLTCLAVLRARRWLLGRAWLRGLVADYGVPLMIIAWSGLSYAVTPAPGVPRRVATPNTWEAGANFAVARRMREVPGPMVAAALLPAAVIAALFFFDHNVSAQLAQQPEFGLAKPPAFHWDFLLLSGLSLACGLLGVPPVNGVLPQAPMHTRSLAHIRKRRLSNGGAAASADGGPQLPATAANGAAPTSAAPAGGDAGRRGSGELRHRHASPERPGGRSPRAPPQPPLPPPPPAQQQQRLEAPEADGPTQAGSRSALNTLVDSAAGAAAPGAGGGGGAEQCPDGDFLRLEVREQRVSNLLQSLLVALCLGATPAIQCIPTAVVWGYFIFLAAQSLTGSQLAERAALLLTDPARRVVVMQREHAAYLQLVPFRAVVRFTLLQLAWLAGVWALTTWAGVGGLAFPLPIVALVPLRQFVLPRLFAPAHLAQLDAASWEEAPALPDRRAAAQELFLVGAIAEAPAPALPVAAGDAGGVAAPSGGEDERSIIESEFRGNQLRHHLTREELEQQRPAPAQDSAQAPGSRDDADVTPPSRGMEVIEGRYIVFFKDGAADAARSAAALVAEVAAALPAAPRVAAAAGAAGASMQLVRTLATAAPDAAGAAAGGARGAAAAAAGAAAPPRGVSAAVLNAPAEAVPLMRKSALVASVVPDFKVYSQSRALAQQPAVPSCVEASALTGGVSTAPSPSFRWPGCWSATSGARLLWLGSPCSPTTAAADTMSRVAFLELRAVNATTGAVLSSSVNGRPCVLTPNRARAGWTRQRFGSCGVAPLFARALPTSICVLLGGALDTLAPMENLLPREPVAGGEEVPAGVTRVEAATTRLGGGATTVVDLSGLPQTQQVVLGVLDSGIDATHKDLNYAGGRAWVTPSTVVPGDVADAGVDLYGCAPRARAPRPRGPLRGARPPAPRAAGRGAALTRARRARRHGTHVAGIAGAANNGAGVVGVAPGLPVFSLKVLNGEGSGSMSDALAAVLWAAGPEGVAAGIKVINLSLAGMLDPARPDHDETLSSVCGVFASAAEGPAGLLIVAAAGNYGDSIYNVLPAACPAVAAVTGVDGRYNEAASFSNFLPSTAPEAERGRVIAAPAVAVVSTMPYSKDPTGYRALSGTSQAAPHVSGIAATCLAAGPCAVPTTGLGKLAVLQAAARERVAAPDGASYAFTGDASRPGLSSRYYGLLTWAKY
ncbi:BOR1 [Scenedesmus sp. PABB004]|nr:BOR1 [Scenedesmus sp. PABB004]